MSNYDINSNPALVKRMIELEKQDDKRYYAEHPDSLIPPFEQELRELGYEFEVSSQIKGFMPKHKETILPIAIKYYQQAKYDNEKNHFLSFFHFKGFEEVVPMLLDDFYSPDTSRLTREFISDTLYQIRSKKYIDDYLKILSNPEYEHYCLFITLLVSSLKVEAAIPIFIKMLDNEKICALGVRALGNYNRTEFRSYFERFENDKRSDVRKYAKAALKKLEK
jgi:hypothetical protein